MLHPVDPDHPPPPEAYRVPWIVTLSDRSHPVLANAGREPVDFVRVFGSNAGREEIVDFWGQVLPAEAVELCLCASDLDDVVITVSWFRRADGLEYVWRFVV